MRRIGWICLGAWLWPVCSTASTATYWNVFNIEGESAVSAAFVTYGTLNDMLRDQNRPGLFEPAAPFGRNVVGSGASIIEDVPAPVPIPATLPLFLGALLSLRGLRMWRALPLGV